MAVAEITAEVEGCVAGSPRYVYDFFREVDVTRILTGRGPLPAVVSVVDPIGRWDAPGQERTLHLADGSSLRERLTTLDPPRSFEYDIDRISGPLGRLVSGFSGRWSFEPSPDDPTGEATLARWHYRFEPHGWLAWPPSFFIVRALWQPYMGKVLERTKALAEQ